MVGGYLIVQASSETDATEMAKGCPIFETGRSVEVRPIREVNL
jgi:hypothetical protein